jgi:hypothetical protein
MKDEIIFWLVYNIYVFSELHLTAVFNWHMSVFLRMDLVPGLLACIIDGPSPKPLKSLSNSRVCVQSIYRDLLLVKALD